MYVPKLETNRVVTILSKHIFIFTPLSPKVKGYRILYRCTLQYRYFMLCNMYRACTVVETELVGTIGPLQLIKNR